VLLWDPPARTRGLSHPTDAHTNTRVDSSDARTQPHQRRARDAAQGGGEVDLKLGMPTDEFLRAYNPFVADITY
jgi:hypothetical protein